MEQEKRCDLVLREGVKLRFPVDSDHSAFAAQKVKTIDCFRDIANFEFARLWAHYAGVQRYPDEVASAFEEQAPIEVARARLLAKRYRTETAFVEVMRLTYAKVFKLILGDFIVPIGATVELTESLNDVSAGRVVISGLLRSRGHLVINAYELRG